MFGLLGYGFIIVGGFFLSVPLLMGLMLSQIFNPREK